MNDGRWAGGSTPGYPGGALPVTPYAIERPGPHQPTGPTRAPWDSAGNSTPPVRTPEWQPTPPAPRPQGPRTFAADAYAEAFLNGRPHPRPAAPVHHIPPHPVSPQRPPPPTQAPAPPQWQSPHRNPTPNPVVPFPIPAPSYAARPPQHPPRHP